MKPSRLEQLSDGIFAIVMTILVFEIRIPELFPSAGNFELLISIKQILPSFFSYVLGFAMLFTYWRAHHFFVSVYAKNINQGLTNINALFFLLVGLVPFSTSLLGKNSENELAIIIFGINTILIGLCLYWMRSYVFRSKTIKNIEVSQKEITHGTIRTFVPVFSAVLAIMLCFIDTKISLTLFAFAILFNFSKTSTTFFNKFIKIITNFFCATKKI
ncbi:MAG: TMEM175 family protein [Candidatus Paceibacterota bacterium]